MKNSEMCTCGHAKQMHSNDLDHCGLCCKDVNAPLCAHKYEEDFGLTVAQMRKEYAKRMV